MPELDFKGKEFVRNHHLTVPFRPLIPDASKSVGEPNLDGNLIIHGDNLEALKSLLPMYAGKVDFIFIDPPYNTGNEGWSYNDNVNSPVLKAWFSENPVGIDDTLRHDKWCAMMWPRLKLLWELTAEGGSIAMTIDSNEFANSVGLFDEIFGEQNRIAQVIWRKVDSPNDNKVALTPDHDYVLIYAKDRSKVVLNKKSDSSILDSYRFPPDGGTPYRDRLLKKNGKNSLRADRPSMFFELTAPDGSKVLPFHDNGEEARWAAGPATVKLHESNGTLIWKERSRGDTFVWEPYTREYAPLEGFRPFPTIWYDLDTSRQAKALLSSIFGRTDVFPTPKPLALIRELFQLIALPEDAVILDSFAGSGTTAHAVHHLNSEMGSAMKYLLVECEDYADTITANRVRRVINGYPYKGSQYEVIMEKQLTWTEIKKGDKLVAEAENTKEMYAANFDSVKIEVKDGSLRVIGHRFVEETARGLGGSFTYCTLGEPLEIESLLSGNGLPSREMLARWLLYVSSGTQAADTKPAIAADLAKHFVAKQGNVYTWLVYEPNSDFLTSADAALTLDLARKIAAVDPKAQHRVFSPAKYVSNKVLREEKLNIEHAAIPFALFRQSGI